MAYSIEIKDFDNGNANFSFYQSGEENKKSSDSGELLKFVHKTMFESYIVSYLNFIANIRII